MKRSPLPALTSTLAAIALLGLAAPAYGNGSNCIFGTIQPLAFGSLDPSLAANQLRTATFQFGDCQGGAITPFTATVDSISSPGAPRMYLNGVVGPDFISYSLGGVTFDSTATPGNNNYRVGSFTGTVLATNYVNARAGTYTDTIRVTVTY
jgi:spore coat protein U-like protein